MCGPDGKLNIVGMLKSRAWGYSPDSVVSSAASVDFFEMRLSKRLYDITSPKAWRERSLDLLVEGANTSPQLVMSEVSKSASVSAPLLVRLR